MAGDKLESRLGKTLDQLSRDDKVAAARTRAKASQGAAVGKKAQRKAGGGAAGKRAAGGRGNAFAGGLGAYQVLGVRRKIGPKKGVGARAKGAASKGGLLNGSSKRARAKGGEGKGQKLVKQGNGAGVGGAPGKRKGIGKAKAKAKAKAKGKGKGKGKAWEDESWGAWEQPVEYAPQRRSRGRGGPALWRGVDRGRVGTLSAGAAKGKGRGRGRGGLGKGNAGVRRTIGGGAQKGGGGAGIFYAALGKGKSRGGKALGGKAAYGGKASGGGSIAKGKGRPAPAALTNGGYAKGTKGYAKGGGAGYAKGGGGGGKGKGGPSAVRSIFFTGADLATPSSELLAHFERVGDVSNFRLLTSSDGRSRGMGICEFTKVYMAEEAIGRLDGTILDGRLLAVRYYEP